jgi:lysophospholipase L1-like esterase
MDRRNFILGVAAALTAGCGSAPTGPTPVTPTPVTPTPSPPDPSGPVPAPVVPVLGITRILTFGDSLTEGTVEPARSVAAPLTAGLPQSYPFKLQTLLRARYSSQTTAVLNGGLAGERVTEPNTRGRFNDDLSEAKPELLLLMDGANDLLRLDQTAEPALSTGIQSAVNAIEDMVRDATGRGIRVMVATLPPVIPGLQRAGSAPYLGKYNAQLKAMAVKKGALVVDVNALLAPSFVGQDGLHLTEAGYQRTAEIFLDAISRAYDVTPAVGAR